ncbi:ComF family protein [Plantactinospora sonchi]|uniref:ComF family protein n=1 Tax=Plantactinospora sonchi TaxID=1544735 RepID=A0ABU7RLG7_9ACTN
MAPAGIWSDLADLVLPTECAGCRGVRLSLRQGACASCVAELAALRPAPSRPTPAPVGLPGCVALGPYQGVLRETLLSYKERGRHGLARPLGRLLAEVVAEAVGERRPVLLVPVPATARAVRDRHGDHLRRLARQAGLRLRAAGWSVAAAHPLRALPRPDSATLDSAGRAAAAHAAFPARTARVPAARRAAAGRAVVVLDDIVTTGVTLAAVTRSLRDAGIPVYAAAVLAATERRRRG